MGPDRLRRIEELYHAAREHSADDASGFLEQACGDELELRREVERLLAQDDAAGHMLDGVAADVFSATADSALPAGTQIGRYVVGALLGRGGMGEVYEARDTRLDRTVAVKMLSEDCAGTSARRRFQQEARAVSALNHPHILTVHDTGEWNGRQYLVTEFVDGGTLKDWAQTPRPWRDAVAILTGVAEGLACAHEAGILHRDIKPQNILVMRGGHAKLADFGLSKLAGSNDETVTRPGAILGTIAYMSPEQAAGKPADPRSDIFSFGVVLYELLAGRRPFGGGSQVEALQAVLHGTAKPLDVGGIPLALKAAVEKAIEKDPERRWRNMRDFAAELRRLAQDEAPHSGKPRRTMPVTLAVLAALGAGAAVWTAIRPGDPAPIRSIAVLPLQNLSGDPGQEYFSEGTTEEIISTLARIKSLRVVSRASVMRYKNAPKSIPEIGQELGVDAIVTGAVRRGNGRIRVSAQLIRVENESHLWANEYDRDLSDMLLLEAEVSQAIAQEIRAQLTPQEQRVLRAARPVNPAARDEYLQARHHAARLNAVDLEKAMAHYERATVIDPNYAEAWGAMAVTAYDRGIWGGPVFRSYEKQARAAAKRALELDPDLPDGHAAMCLIHSGYDWNWDAAERECRRAIELEPNNPGAHRQYSVLLQALGRADEAVAEIERAARFDPVSSDLESFWGRALYRARRYDEAVTHLRKAIALDPQNFGAHTRLADTYLQMGKSSEAIAEIEKTKGLKEALLVKSDWIMSAYARAGREAEARALLKKHAEDPGAYQRSFSMAVAYFALGEIDNGFAALRRSFDMGALVIFMGAEPQFDGVRSDPRFRELMERMGLAHRH